MCIRDSTYSVQARIVAADGRQDPGLIEQHAMVSVVESMLQTSPAGADCSSGCVHPLESGRYASWCRYILGHTITTRSIRHTTTEDSSALYRPEELLDLLGRLVNYC